MALKEKKKKILVFVPSLAGGGSERFIVYFVNNLDREKFDIKLALIKKEGPYLDELKKDIPVIDLNSKRARYALFKIIKLIKDEKPDLVFSTLGYLNILLAMVKKLFPNIKFVARESNIQSKRFSTFFKYLAKLFYKYFDLIIAQAKCMKKDLVENFNVPEDKVKVIYNPVDIENIYKKSLTNEKLFSDKYKNLIAIGRLTKQKGFDLLLKAFSKLDNNYRLYILGEGEEKDNLIKLADKLNIKDRVYFLGFQKNPYKYLAQADLMVLSSKVEGLPNVVLEANALGIPVVAFDCPGGTREIIKNGLNGFLVKCEDVDKLAFYIEKAVNYNWDKSKIIKYIKENFSVEKIIKKYEDALLSLLKT